MKAIFLFSTFSLFLFANALAQEYATYTLTGVHQGTGTFTNAILSDFTWQVNGTLANEVQILDDEVFDDGNELENTFGQADNEQNLRIKVIPNGAGTAGQPITATASLTLNFDLITPSEGWGFCLVDIDVENALISAIDENNNHVSFTDIDNWLVELFDANLFENGINIPKWDASNSALLGSDTPNDYVVYNNLVIGGMSSSEAPAAFFKPDMALKSLTIDFENLQENYSTSYHFYIASINATGIPENNEINFTVYPNPTDAITTINLISSNRVHGDLFLYNSLGIIVLQAEIDEDKFTFDASQLPIGTYYTQIIVDRKPLIRKIIITK